MQLKFPRTGGGSYIAEIHGPNSFEMRIATIKPLDNNRWHVVYESAFLTDYRATFAYLQEAKDSVSFLLIKCIKDGVRR